MFNNKMLLIIDDILHSNGSLSVDRLCGHLNLSRRVLLYNIDNINFLLRKNKIPEIRIEADTVTFPTQEAAAVQKLFSSMETSYVPNSDERRSVIILYTGLCSRAVSLNFLCDLFDFSRNTIINEINRLKTMIADDHIQLGNSGKSGYRFSGDELNIRYLILQHYYQISACPLRSTISRMIYESVAPYFKETAPNDFDSLSAAIQDIVKRSETISRFTFSHSSVQDIALYLIVIFLRCSGNEIHYDFYDPEIACNQPALDSVQFILEEMGKIGLEIPESEKYYITCVLLGEKTAFNYDSSLEYNSNLVSLVTDLIDNFESKTAVSFTQREALFRQLLIHLQPMYYRLKYNIYTENPFYQEIINMYQDLYLITDIVVRDVEEKYAFSMPAPEKAYLCIYFGSFLANSPLGADSSDTHILLICTNGVGTSILLAGQLQNLFGDDCCIDTVDLREFRQSPQLQDNCQLIVSTVPVHSENVPVILTDPILTDSQRDKLLNWYLQHANIKMSGMLDIIQKYALIQNRELLITNLQKYFSKNAPEPEELHLKDLFPPQYLNYCRADHPRRDKAVEFACAPLLRDGRITQEYVRKNIELLNTYNLYAEIFPGVLLVHAKPSDGVLKPGITMTLFQTPVVFEDNPEAEIRLFVTLAAIDNKLHFNALQEMIHTLSSTGVLEYLFSLDMNQVTSNDLYYRLMNQVRDPDTPFC